jgi:hypothetical protein
VKGIRAWQSKRSDASSVSDRWERNLATVLVKRLASRFFLIAFSPRPARRSALPSQPLTPHSIILGVPRRKASK